MRTVLMMFEFGLPAVIASDNFDDYGTQHPREDQADTLAESS